MHHDSLYLTHIVLRWAAAETWRIQLGELRVLRGLVSGVRRTQARISRERAVHVDELIRACRSAGQVPARGRARK
jgi:hypothetical protein